MYGVVAAQIETFFARQRDRDRIVPRFVERELWSFLDCGVLARGFIRVHCDDCGKDRLVAFSCKGRGSRASCTGRRMADTAAHLVDRVLPEAPVRQWVLSLPFALRYRLAFDARLVGEVLRIFVAEIFASMRRRAGERRRMPRASCGAATLIQRFGGAVNLNVHLHTLALDGVYVSGEPGEVHFRPVPPLDDAEVARVTTRVARRIAKLLYRRGLGAEVDPEAEDPLSQDDPLLAALYSSSIRGTVAAGPRTAVPCRYASRTWRSASRSSA